jgi:hypothetical protein
VSAYSIVNIPGWENLSLNSADTGELRRRINELAHNSVPEEVPRDTATPFRMEMRKHLNRLVEQSRETGAGLICIPTSRMGDISVPASYTVSEWRDTEDDHVAPAAVLKSIADSSEAVCEMVFVDGQPALREETDETGDLRAEELATHPGRRVTYTVSAPEDAKTWLVFNFVTLGNGDPRGALADALVELFDAQITTLRWRNR